MAVKFRTKEERDEYRDSFFAPATPIEPSQPSASDQPESADRANK